MTGIIEEIRSALTTELDRFRHRRFLNAAMAAGAYLASSDGEILLSERLALDSVLANVEKLQIYNVHDALDLFRDYGEAIRKDPVKGKEKVMKAVSHFAGDEHTSAILMRVCVFIAKADGECGIQEQEVISELCRTLELSAPETQFYSTCQKK